MSAKTEQWKGRIKQAVGSLIGNKRLENEGRADRQAADAKRQLAIAKNKVVEMIDKATSSIEGALDAAKDKRRRR
jgi:uncharacterized protein YjbJ (UPF0337 family)